MFCSAGECESAAGATRLGMRKSKSGLVADWLTWNPPPVILFVVSSVID